MELFPLKKQEKKIHLQMKYKEFHSHTNARIIGFKIKQYIQLTKSKDNSIDRRSKKMRLEFIRQRSQGFRK